MISYEEMDTKYNSLEPFYVEPQEKYELINRATEQLDGSTFHSEPGEETVNGITNYTSIVSNNIQPVEKYETLNPQKVESETKYYNRQTQKEGRENPEVPHGDTYIGNKNVYEDLDNIEISYSIDAENAHSSNSGHKKIRNDVNISTIERNLKDKKEFIKITISKKTCLALSITLALLFLLALIGGMGYYFYFINAADSTSGTNTDFPVNISTQEPTIMSLPSSSTDDLETTLMPIPTNIIDTPCINITCKNNGSCHERDIGSVCECPVGFEGIFCEIEIDECASSPCQNGGTCLDKINGYECSCVICKCADEVAGPNCEVDSPCITTLCQNGGSCDANTVGNCICIDGYVGQLCDMVRENCITRNCTNGATCDDSDPTIHAVCNCTDLYTGERCEKERNPCDSSPCMNGGICDREQGLNYTCECAYPCSCANDPELAGKKCENDLTTCDGFPGNGEYIYAHDCSKRLECWDQYKAVSDCPDMKYFNPGLDPSIHPGKGECGEKPSCYTTPPPTLPPMTTTPEPP